MRFLIFGLFYVFILHCWSQDTKPSTVTIMPRYTPEPNFFPHKFKNVLEECPTFGLRLSKSDAIPSKMTKFQHSTNTSCLLGGYGMSYFFNCEHLELWGVNMTGKYLTSKYYIFFPAVHTINEFTYPVELDIVLTNGSDHAVVICVMFIIGLTPNKSAQELAFALYHNWEDRVDISRLLPSKDSNVYTYKVCNDTMDDMIVFEDPLTMTEDERTKLLSFFRLRHRPVYTTSDRTIYYSGEEEEEPNQSGKSKATISHFLFVGILLNITSKLI